MRRSLTVGRSAGGTRTVTLACSCGAKVINTEASGLDRRKSAVELNAIRAQANEFLEVDMADVCSCEKEC